MATQSTSNPADVVNRMQTYFSKKLLVTAEPLLTKREFAQMGDLPANSGTKTVRFYRRREASAADVVALTEGTPINTFTEITYENVDVTLVQRGEATKITDVLQDIDIFNPLTTSIQAMSEDAVLSFDGVIRDAFLAGYLNSNGKNERFCGRANTGNSATDFAAFHALTAANAKWTRAAHLAALTQLKVGKAPKVNNKFVAILPPQVSHDVMSDPDWKEAAKYAGSTQLFKGELGELDGVRFIEDTNPIVEDSVYGTYNEAGGNYGIMYLGREAYGVSKLGGGKGGNASSPWAPKVIINNNSDKSDPLNQFAIAGWKAFFSAKLLNRKFGVLLRCKSTFV